MFSAINPCLPMTILTRSIFSRQSTLYRGWDFPAVFSRSGLSLTSPPISTQIRHYIILNSHSNFETQMNHMPEDLPATFEDMFDNIEFPAELFDFLSDIVSEPEANLSPVIDHPQTISQKQGNDIYISKSTSPFDLTRLTQ